MSPTGEPASCVQENNEEEGDEDSGTKRNPKEIEKGLIEVIEMLNTTTKGLINRETEVVMKSQDELLSRKRSRSIDVVHSCFSFGRDEGRVYSSAVITEGETFSFLCTRQWS